MADQISGQNGIESSGGVTPRRPRRRARGVSDDIPVIAPIESVNGIITDGHPRAEVALSQTAPATTSVSGLTPAQRRRILAAFEDDIRSWPATEAQEHAQHYVDNMIGAMLDIHNGRLGDMLATFSRPVPRGSGQLGGPNIYHNMAQLSNDPVLSMGRDTAVANSEYRHVLDAAAHLMHEDLSAHRDRIVDALLTPSPSRVRGHFASHFQAIERGEWLHTERRGDFIYPEHRSGGRSRVMPGRSWTEAPGAARALRALLQSVEEHRHESRVSLLASAPEVAYLAALNGDLSDWVRETRFRDLEQRGQTATLNSSERAINYGLREGRDRDTYETASQILDGARLPVSTVFNTLTYDGYQVHMCPWLPEGYIVAVSVGGQFNHHVEPLTVQATHDPHPAGGWTLEAERDARFQEADRAGTAVLNIGSGVYSWNGLELGPRGRAHRSFYQVSTPGSNGQAVHEFTATTAAGTLRVGDAVTVNSQGRITPAVGNTPGENSRIIGYVSEMQTSEAGTLYRVTSHNTIPNNRHMSTFQIGSDSRARYLLNGQWVDAAGRMVPGDQGQLSQFFPLDTSLNPNPYAGIVEQNVDANLNIRVGLDWATGMSPISGPLNYGEIVYPLNAVLGATPNPVLTNPNPVGSVVDTGRISIETGGSGADIAPPASTRDFAAQATRLAAATGVTLEQATQRLAAAVNAMGVGLEQANTAIGGFAQAVQGVANGIDAGIEVFANVRAGFNFVGNMHLTLDSTQPSGAAEAAEERAKGLLLSYLSEAQRREYEKRGCITLQGKSGYTYSIAYGKQQNIEVMHPKGPKIGVLCAAPNERKHRLPIFDAMLAQFLHLQFNEEHFWHSANFFWDSRLQYSVRSKTLLPFTTHAS